MSTPTSRFEFARRNAGFGLATTLATTVIGFASRTVFISTLGSAYLGVNALLTNVLGVLSFMELGIGAAMSYSLYKPVAEHNAPRIRALTRFYRKVYRIIALLVTVIGLALLPFIPYIAKGAENIGDLRLYYLLFLAANVLSYFAVYKTSIAAAEQRNYIVTNINTVASIVMQAAQIVALLVWESYLSFLIVMLLGRAVQQLFLNWYLSRRYREYLADPEFPITDEELEPIKKNVKALIWHKIGDIAINQTDSIIIAAFVNVTILGMISNYNLIVTTATMLLTVVINAAIGSFGNAIATSSPEDVYRNYKTYRFAAFWIYGLATAGMAALISPLITLWLGATMLIQQGVVLLILLNFYMLGHRATIVALRSAAGIWSADKFLPLVQAVVNLAGGIVLVQTIGVIGVYVATIAQGLIATVARPIIVYPRVFNARAREYFADGARYLAVVVLAGATATWAVQSWLPRLTWLSFIGAILAVFVWINVLFLLFFARRPEFRALIARIRRR